VTAPFAESSDPTGFAGPYIVSEEFQGELVSWVESNRLAWDGFTVVELAAPKVVSDWFGFAGADRLLILGPSGGVVEQFSSPFGYRLESVTAVGSSELVVEELPAGVTGCCSGLVVMTVEGGQLGTLFSVGAFGDIALQDLDGDSLPEVIGHNRLLSNVLPNVARLTLPFVCKWGGSALRDATRVLYRPVIEAEMAGLRAGMRESGFRYGSIELYGLALLLSEREAQTELAWMESVVSPDAFGEVSELVPDIRRNLAEWRPCGS